MSKYKIVRFNDKYAVQKTTLGIFTSFVSLTREDTTWMCWEKSSSCFGDCLGDKERATYVYNLTQDGEDVT